MLRVAAVCFVIVLVTPWHARLAGQSPPPAGPRFEVASIKPGKSPAEIGRAMAVAGGGGGQIAFPVFGVRVQPGGRLVGTANLQTLVLRAYGIREYQLEGGPKWLTTDYFDITAKAESETATEADINEMLKSLLAERFGLRVHVETRPSPVHMLTIARADGKLGSGLKPTSPECITTLEERKRDGATAPPLSGFRERMTPICGLTSESMTPRTATATFTMGGQPFSSLVARISRELGAPVVDQTGLTGPFDVAIEFETSRKFSGVPPAGPDPNTTDPLPVPLPGALQQQLGLKLEKGTGPLPITIIDAAELPSPN
jgi:uncharacterized protein (TIGR03435 family)